MASENTTIKTAAFIKEILKMANVVGKEFFITMTLKKWRAYGLMEDLQAMDIWLLLKSFMMGTSRMG